MSRLPRAPFSGPKWLDRPPKTGRRVRPVELGLWGNGPAGCGPSVRCLLAVGRAGVSASEPTLPSAPKPSVCFPPPRKSSVQGLAAVSLINGLTKLRGGGSGQPWPRSGPAGFGC